MAFNEANNTIFLEGETSMELIGETFSKQLFETAL